MHFSNAILLAGVVASASATMLTTGQLKSRSALAAIMERQFRICKPVSTPSCSLSCGAGYVVCVSWPTCYNPSAGASCCSDGTYCPKGYYCTDNSCCPDGSTLEECGATKTLTIIPPPAAESTSSYSPPSTSSKYTPPTTSSAVYGGTTTSTTTAYYTSSYTSSSTPYSAVVSSSSTKETPSPSPTTTPSPTSVRSSNGTTTTSKPLQVTNAAQTMGVGAAQLAVGGLGALLMML